MHDVRACGKATMRFEQCFDSCLPHLGTAFMFMLVALSKAHHVADPLLETSQSTTAARFVLQLCSVENHISPGSFHLVVDDPCCHPNQVTYTAARVTLEMLEGRCVL